MAEQKAQQTGSARAQELPVSILAQYVRDISFENPHAPDSLKMAGQGMQPAMDVSIGLDARKMPDESGLYEVVMSARAEALSDGKTMFLCEIQYGLICKIDGSVDEDQHHPLVFIEVPRLAFPFIRQIIAMTVANGGFPPLYLSPVDFHQLYVERFGDDSETAESTAEPTAEDA